MARFWVEKEHSEVLWPTNSEDSFLRVERVAVGNSESDGLVYRNIVRHPGAVVVVAYLEDVRSLLFIKQYRAALDAEVIELAAGKRDVIGEAPIDCAMRELEEELGVTASIIEPLITFYNTPGFSDEETQVFLARGLSSVEVNPQSAEERSAQRMIAPIERVDELIESGIIIDGKTILGIFALKRRVQAGLAHSSFVDTVAVDQFVSL